MPKTLKPASPRQVRQRQIMGVLRQLEGLVANLGVLNTPLKAFPEANAAAGRAYPELVAARDLIKTQFRAEFPVPKD